MKVDRRIRIIFFLPLLIGMASLAHALFPTGLIFLLFLLISFYIDLFYERYFSGTALTIFSIFITLFLFILALRMPFEAVSYWIMTLSVVKMLGKKTLRDFKQIIALSFFNFIDSAIFHYTFVFLIYLALYIITTSIALLIITFLDEKRGTYIDFEIHKTLRKFGIYFGIATLFMSLFFFFILPRSPYVVLKAQIYSPLKREGFGNELSIGDVESMSNREQILIRIKPLFKSKPDFLYIRGNVYNIYSGNKWSREPEKLLNWSYLERKTSLRAQPYQITIEPINTKVLYAPNFPEKIEIRLLPHSLSWGKVILLETPNIQRKLQYIAYSSNEQDTEFPEALNFFQIPEELKPLLDTILIKENLIGTDAGETANKIRNYFLSRYTYAIESYDNADWIPAFLEKKKGYCEHFATLTALLLRASGIPSRTVAGFLTNEWNSFGSYFTVRTKHAHMWVEYYFNGKWMTLETTPPISRENIFLSRAQEYLDYLAYLWTTQVLEFSFINQMRLFQNLNAQLRKLFKPRNLKRLIYTLFILSALIIAVYSLLNKIKEKEHIATKYYKNFEKLLKKKGYQISPSTTAKEIEKMLNLEEASDFLQEYLKCRFSNECDFQSLKKKFEAFREKIS